MTSDFSVIFDTATYASKDAAIPNTLASSFKGEMSNMVNVTVTLPPKIIAATAPNQNQSQLTRQQRIRDGGQLGRGQFLRTHVANHRQLQIPNLNLIEQAGTTKAKTRCTVKMHWNLGPKKVQGPELLLSSLP
ncbi:MAG: hypothetical protein JXX14_08385 [Deltaproteobacteria bacterium]|nr:hypothetical protein [Deltaproteobacteria bacterium]